MKGNLERRCPNCGDGDRFYVDEYDNLVCTRCGKIIGSAEIEMKVVY